MTAAVAAAGARRRRRHGGGGGDGRRAGVLGVVRRARGSSFFWVGEPPHGN